MNQPGTNIPQKGLTTAVVYLSAVVCAALFLFPFLWMVLTALKSARDIFSHSWFWPNRFYFGSFRDVLDTVPFGLYFRNTFIFVFGLLLCQMITITFAAFAFARFKFPLKDLLFSLLLVQLMIAPQTLIAPNYVTIKDLGLLNSLPGISMPYIASAIGVFLLRQAFKSIPLELEDAATIDGASTESYLFRIAIPLVKPTYVAFALVSISYHWNEFFWPLIVTDTDRSRLLTVGLALFAEQSRSAAAWNDLMAATLLVVVLPLILFLFFQKSFVQGFATSGLKG